MKKMLTLFVVSCLIQSISSGNPLPDETVSVGDFNEDESPSATWMLFNKNKEPLKISAIQRTCSCLLLEYRQLQLYKSNEQAEKGLIEKDFAAIQPEVESVDENSDDVYVFTEWNAIEGNSTTLFSEIPAGLAAQIRVSIAPFGRSGPFSKKVFVSIVNSDEIITLSVAGNAKPLVFLCPKSPLIIGSVPPGTTTTFSAKLVPREKNVCLGSPYVTNALTKTSCLLNTNTVPWVLTVSITPESQHVGPVGCDIIVPIVGRGEYPPVILSLQGTTIGCNNNEASTNPVSTTLLSTKPSTLNNLPALKSPSATTIEVFRSPGCKICPRLEREIFDQLNLLPEYVVIYMDLDNVEVAKSLMKYKTKLGATLNEPVNVVIDKKTLLEGGKQIRAKLTSKATQN